MMTKRYFLPLLLVAVILATACENEIPFNLKNNPPKLVMNALINADSATNKLFLNLTGVSNLKSVKEALVEVRVNGTLTEVAKYLPAIISQDYYLTGAHYLLTTRFRPDDVVRIDAHTTDGIHHAWAEVTVPQPLSIGQVDTLSTRIRYNGSFEDMMRYRFTFSDRPQEKNFYRLVLERRTTLCIRTYQTQKDSLIIGKSTQLISGDDIVLSDGQPDMGNNDSMFEKATNIYGIFDDSRLTADPYTMTAYTYLRSSLYSYHGMAQWEKTDVFVRLLSISETEYYYLKTLNVIDSDIYDETLMEPIRFPSNVNGGLGIVSISTETSTKVSLPKLIYPTLEKKQT